MSNFRRRAGQPNNELIHILADLQHAGTGKIVIEPDGDHLKLEVFHTEGKKKGLKSMTITLSFPTFGGFEALPIPSRIDFDEEKQLIQQRMPVKYLMQSQKPRSDTHVWGFAPKMRRTQRYPLSKTKYKRKRKRKGGTRRPKTQNDWKEVAKSGGLDFLDSGSIFGEPEQPAKDK